MVARTISAGLAGILEELELEQPAIVTVDRIAELAGGLGVRTPARNIAARMLQEGWLLTTDQPGVYEFAPAAVGGPYSRSDPLTPLWAFLARRPDARVGLTFQAAAWARGLADRVPVRPEVAAATDVLARQLPDALAGSIFAPRLPYETLRDVPVLATESIIVQMAARPTAVRSWASAHEWFPALAAEVEPEALRRELEGRPVAVHVRSGYLLSGVRPDVAETIRRDAPPSSKTWFGPRRSLRRHNAMWLVADTILPFDPATLEPVI